LTITQETTLIDYWKYYRKMVKKKVANIRVRYADTDKMGIVYNGNYLSFFETGRTELLRGLGLPYKVVEENGFLLPLIDSYAKYHVPAVYDDIIDVHVSMDLSETPKIKFDYELYKDDNLITSGYTRHVFVKFENMKPIRPPKLFMDIISNIES
jgi:acyl-CoA thioester hydrolase